MSRYRRPSSAIEHTLQLLGLSPVQRQYSITNDDLNRFFSQNVTLSREETKKCIKAVMETVVQHILAQVNLDDWRFQKNVFYGGSYWQGLKVNMADEFDLEVRMYGLDIKVLWSSMIMAPKYFKLIETNPQLKEAAVFVKKIIGSRPVLISRGSLAETDSLSPTIKVVPSLYPDFENYPIGYVQLPVTSQQKEWYETSPELAVDGVLIPFLVRRRLKQLLSEAIRELGLSEYVQVQKKAHGPAITMVVQPGHSGREHLITVDLVPTAAVKAPLPRHINWPHPNTKWPSRDKVEEIMDIGVNLVAKKDLYWLISYAEAEKKLVENIDQDGGCRKKVLRILKYLNEKFWHDNNRPLVSSYVIKNVWFWECETYWESSSWQPEMLTQRFYSMIERILRALRQRSLCQYFDPKINLLQGKSDRDINLLWRKICEFLSAPERYLQ